MIDAEKIESDMQFSIAQHHHIPLHYSLYSIVHSL